MTGTLIRSRKLRQRRRHVRRERVRTYTRRAVAVLVIGGTLAAGTAVAGSSLFAVNRVEVSGARTTGADTVRAASGIRPGANALTLDLDGARRRVEALPLIREAVVRRAGALTVRITVVERAPAVVVRVGTARRFFDLDGVEVPGPARGKIPVVWLTETPRTFADGRTVLVHPQPTPTLVADVLAVWRAAGDLRSSLGRFDVTDRGLVVAIGRTSATLGDTSEIRRKMATLRTIIGWASARERAVRSVDVRVPQHPAMRLA